MEEAAGVCSRQAGVQDGRRGKACAALGRVARRGRLWRRPLGWALRAGGLERWMPACPFVATNKALIIPIADHLVPDHPDKASAWVRGRVAPAVLQCTDDKPHDE